MYVCIYTHIYTYMLKLTQLRNTQPDILPLEGQRLNMASFLVLVSSN